MTEEIVVLVTCRSAKEARGIARALVEARVAACGNVLEAPVRSIYRWKGRVEAAKEYLLIIKASRRRFAALEKAVKRLHSYDVPEIIALPVAAGSADYLRWLGECVDRESTKER
jgi:periplasmic divalent cation tolerance protein